MDFISHQAEKILACYTDSSLSSCINKAQESDIEKGGSSAQIGEIREWKGKKYKKQANGKWLEISEHGMTKKDSEKELDRIRFNNQYGHSSIEEQSKLGKIHSNIKNLSDKEHSDEEIGIKKDNKVEKSKSNDKFAKVMGEFKAGALKSSDGSPVTKRSQAIAIAMSESGKDVEKADAKDETED